MGKSSKGAEKKAARAAALAAEKERVAHVKSVASIAEPLADFAPFVKAAKAKFGTEIEHYTRRRCPKPNTNSASSCSSGT